MTALHRQAGLSLIELMIAIAIGLFLLAGLVTVFATSNRTYVELNRASQQIENGRFAVQLLSDDVALAGFYGRYALQLPVPGALPDPCETTTPSTLRSAAGFSIQGYDAPPAVALPACIGGTVNHQPGTDILVVRRVDSQTTALGSLVAAQVYMQSNADPASGSNPILAPGTAANFTPAPPGLQNKDSTVAPIRKYHVHVYFVAPCSVPAGGGTVCTGATDDNGAPIPTLKRLELTVDPADNTRKMLVVPLVEGIENFQVDYGIDSDADGAPNSYLTAPAALADWANVVAVKVNVLARNLERSPDYSDTKKYDMGIMGTLSAPGVGGTLETLAPNYKRHVYNAVIRVVNPSSRRES